MNKFFKTLSFLLIFIAWLCNSAYSFDLDETVDDEIRKKYNDTKLINDTGISTPVTDKKSKTAESMPPEELPSLPSITKYPDNKPKPANVNSNTNSTPPQTTISYHAGSTKIKKGTTFYVSSSNAISDSQTRGTKVKFVLKTAVQNKNYNIPAWTAFNGEIVESHTPQITCNGGLVSIRIYSMTYKGQTIPINAYIVRANDKNIFFNDIKGNRTYLKTMWKKGGWGRNMFNKMMSLTIKLGAETSTLILSPFPFAYGTICLGLNALTSPITAFFSKGGRISIPAGSQFKIKLMNDTYID